MKRGLNLLIFSSLISFVIADSTLVIRVLFNEGNPLGNGVFCTQADEDKLEQAVRAVEEDDRYRRLQSNIMDIVTDRELSSYPPKCKKSCAGYTSGYCMVADCKKYRRRGLREVGRDLDWSSDCAGRMKQLNDALNRVKSSLSSSCRTLVNAPRYMSCMTEHECLYGNPATGTYQSGEDDEDDEEEEEEEEGDD